LRIPLCLDCDLSCSGEIRELIERRQDDLDVCIDHAARVPLGEPFELKKLLVLARYPRIYVKLSALWSRSGEEYPYRDTHDLIWTLYHAFGPSRLLWGSDFPAVERKVGYARAISVLRTAIPWLADEDRRQTLGNTASKIWPAA
jgi:predicted TIM-barrel fold metal-dependent hydrolase